MPLESFVAPDTNEGMSPAAFEAFKEKVKKSAAQMAAAKKKEKKFKKKEADLAKILVKFIKTSNKKKLVNLISRALAKEIPANFILAIILLGNDEIDSELNKIIIQKKEELTFFKVGDGKLPTKVKMKLDGWIKNILVSLEEKTKKIFNNGTEGESTEKNPIQELRQLTVFVLTDFLEYRKLNQSNTISSEKLANFVLKIAMSHAEDIIKEHFQPKK